jgi:hypothetical protein
MERTPFGLTFFQQLRDALWPGMVSGSGLAAAVAKATRYNVRKENVAVVHRMLRKPSKSPGFVDRDSATIEDIPARVSFYQYYINCATIV